LDGDPSSPPYIRIERRSRALEGGPSEALVFSFVGPSIGAGYDRRRRPRRSGERAPAGGPLSRMPDAAGSDRLDVRSLLSLRPLNDVECDFLSLSQRSEALAGDRRGAHDHVTALVPDDTHVPLTVAQ